MNSTDALSNNQQVYPITIATTSALYVSSSCPSMKQ